MHYTQGNGRTGIRMVIGIQARLHLNERGHTLLTGGLVYCGLIGLICHGGKVNFISLIAVLAAFACIVEQPFMVHVFGLIARVTAAHGRIQFGRTTRIEQCLVI